MQAIAGHMGADHAAVGAIRAGCDVLLLCRDERNQALAEEGLIKAAEADSAFRARVGESAARVRAMKRAHAQNQARHPAPPFEIVGASEHRRLADRLAGRV
jgi:beta-N-acetylhexosaminidase